MGDQERGGVSEEARISKLEVMVENLSSSIKQGFDNMQSALIEIRKGTDENIIRIHQRMDTHEREGKLNPGLIVSIIGVSVLIGGVLVSFVNMNDAAIRATHESDVQWREKIEAMRYSHLREIIEIQTKKENTP